MRSASPPATAATPSDTDLDHPHMLRWIILLVVTLLVFDALQPWLRRIGLGRLPGDVEFRFAGRTRVLPIGSAVLLSVLGWAIGKLL